MEGTAMFKKVTWAIVSLFIGVMLIFAGARESIIYIKKTTVDLNTAPMSDFNKVAIAKGEIGCVLGSFATMTEEQKFLGIIPGSKHETEYYLVENLTRDEIVKIENGEESPSVDGFLYVVAASTDEMKAALDKNIQDWIDYDDGKTDKVPEAVQFEGKLWKQSKEDDYLKYRDDFVAECGLSTAMLAEYRAQDTKINAGCFAVLAIGFGCLIFGIIDSIIVIRHFLNRKKEY